MRKRLAAAVSAAVLVMAPAAAHAADVATVTSGPATVTATGAWPFPDGCGKYAYTWAGVADFATVSVLDVSTRKVLASDMVMTPAGTGAMQVCDFSATRGQSLVLSFDVYGSGVAESAPFTWTAPASWARPAGVPKAWTCPKANPAQAVETCTFVQRVSAAQSRGIAGLLAASFKTKLLLQASGAGLSDATVKVSSKRDSAGRLVLTGKVTFGKTPVYA